jgi:hypothetical protein
MARGRIDNLRGLIISRAGVGLSLPSARQAENDLPRPSGASQRRC